MSDENQSRKLPPRGGESLTETIVAAAKAFGEVFRAGVSSVAYKATMHYQRTLAENRVANRFLELEEQFRLASDDSRHRVCYDFCQTVHLIPHADTKFNCMQAILHMHDQDVEEAIEWMNKTISAHYTRTLGVLNDNVTKRLPQKRPRSPKKPPEPPRSA